MVEFGYVAGFFKEFILKTIDKLGSVLCAKSNMTCGLVTVTEILREEFLDGNLPLQI